jgi:cation:H+ antiporter
LLSAAQLILGIAILYWGAEWLLRGTSAMARTLGVATKVATLLVFAYGNSAPELAVATKTALDHPPIALGTVVGSCAANISLILGLTALIAPPTINGQTIRREIPVLVGSVIAVPILFRNGVLSRLEGMLLIGCAIIFTIATIVVAARIDPDDPSDDADIAPLTEDSATAMGGRGRRRVSPLVSSAMLAMGLVLLVVGAKLFVEAARTVGAQAGMSERMIGLTIVSLGTSLPELLASVLAATRGQPATMVGTVIGSNLMNVFLVLGITAYLRPIHLGERMHVVDGIGLVVITLLGVLVLRGSRRISRLEGAVLVAAYIGFIVAAAIF